MMLPDIFFLKHLLQCASVTPDDAGCMDVIAQYLQTTPINYHQGDTNNSYFELGTGDTLFLFVGHTDVVPPGPLDYWDNHPFSCQETNPIIARGIVDMKGAIWAFCHALKTVQHKLKGRVGILLTSDEEGDGQNGMQSVIPKLQQQGFLAQWALVGEPTCVNNIGDYYKHERRGSYTFNITLKGQQGHTAYPDQAWSPNTALSQFLISLQHLQETLPEHHNISLFSVNTSTSTSNIIPQSISIGLNLRYFSKNTIKQCMTVFQQHHAAIQEKPGALPYQAKPIRLKEALEQAVSSVTGLTPQASIKGGTSDARFLKPIAQEIIEFGLRSEYAHKINEQATETELHQLTNIYQELLLNLLSKT